MNGVAGFGESGRSQPPRRRRRRWVIGVLVVVVVAGALGAVGEVFASAGGSSGESGDNGLPTSLATVTRRVLSTADAGHRHVGVCGLLPGARSGPGGTVTWLPAVGQVIGQGQVLYQVDGAPVVLLYGSTPAWRALAAGATAAEVTGQDVAQLNHDLVALGFTYARPMWTSAWDRVQLGHQVRGEEVATTPRGGAERQTRSG